MKNKCILDPRCIRCLQPLSEVAFNYWQKINDLRPIGEPSIMRAECVKCAIAMGKVIPPELINGGNVKGVPSLLEE